MSDTNNLLALAQELGYDGFIVEDGKRAVRCHIYTEPLKEGHRAREFRRSIEFNPSENPAQMVEIMKHFKIYLSPLVNPEAWYAEYKPNAMAGHGSLINAEGKTPMEAVLNCALSIMETKGK